MVKKEESATKKIVINAMMIALTFVATMCVNIRLPIVASGGLIHLGNVPLFFAAILYGKKTGAVAGAFGMALFDMISGWALWAPFTFVIMGIIGYMVGRIAFEKCTVFRYWLAMAVALVIKIAGYYFAEGLLYRNWITPINSIPGNVSQIVVAAVIVFPIILSLRKIVQRQEGRKHA